MVSPVTQLPVNDFRDRWTPYVHGGAGGVANGVGGAFRIEGEAMPAANARALRDRRRASAAVGEAGRLCSLDNG